MNQRVSIEAIEGWVDNSVAAEWNITAAARVYHIACSGWDGIVEPASSERPAHLHVVSSDHEVPGACAPVTNLYHASQVLSWITASRSTIEQQGEWMQSIPTLIEQLRVLSLSVA
jgi:hypothetical protein